MSSASSTRRPSRTSSINQRITTKSAEANFQNAKLTREVAEIAVSEYKEGVYVQDLQTVEGEIKLAESDLIAIRGPPRVGQADVREGLRLDGPKVSEELNFKKAQFTLEQAQSKKKVLVEYTNEKTIKELESEVEEGPLRRAGQAGDLGAGEEQGRRSWRSRSPHCTLVAPIDGLVVYANDPDRMFGSNQPQIEEGATVRERQKIISIPDITRMQVNAKVHESQIDKISPEHEGPDPRRRLRRPGSSTATVTDVAPLPDAGQLLQLRHQGLHDPHPDRRPARTASGRA